MGSGFEATARSSGYRGRVLELWWSSSQKRSVLVNVSFMCMGGGVQVTDVLVSLCRLS